MKHIEVAAAVITRGEHVFCAQRKDSGELARKWEFPGGKLETGESGEEALLREIAEELDASITIRDHLITVEHQYESFFITMHAYLCTLDSDTLLLREHLDSVWLPKADLSELDWAAADIPVVRYLQEYLS